MIHADCPSPLPTPDAFDARAALDLEAALACDPLAWERLPLSARLGYGLRLRDMFFARSQPPDPASTQALHVALSSITSPAAPFRDDDLDLSFHPTASMQALRWVDASRIDPQHRALFASPTSAPLGYLAAFADPAALHFRNFEDIIPLDRLWEARPDDPSSSPPLSFTLGPSRPPTARADAADAAERVHLYALRLDGTPHSVAALQALDGLGLYAAPLNPRARGGQRFIFHSALLAAALTEAVRGALPADVMKGFSHVNPVFRCNRFLPSDHKFDAHYDSPYYDAAHHHISRFTLLIYITGGEGSPALDVEGLRLDVIDPMTCVLFDQRHPHEGHPFKGGPKVFLRSELIFEDRDLTHDPALGKGFAQACYAMTGAHARYEALSRFAHDRFNAVAAARWRSVPDLPPDAEEPFVHRDYMGLHYVANGYDYWVASDALTLPQCAALLLLDLFNADLLDLPGALRFRELCAEEVIHGQRDGAWIPGFLAERARPQEPPLHTLRLDLMFPPPERPDLDSPCCPTYADHEGVEFDSTRHPFIHDLYARAQSRARSLLERAPVVIMCSRVFLNEAQFVIEGDKIHVLSHQRLAPMHFAGCNFAGQHHCWHANSIEDFIGVEAEALAPQPLVPPILFTEVDGCYHLMFDLFRNDWMAHYTDQPVYVPHILMYPSRSRDWVNKTEAALSAAAGDVDAPPSDPPYGWGYGKHTAAALWPAPDPAPKPDKTKTPYKSDDTI
jgi:hypothetical protein